MSDGGSFLSRWSRRKRAAGVPVAPPPAASAPAGVAPPDALPPTDTRPVFDPASLPPVEGLTAESDFAAFLREEVPTALRRAALRRAWTLDPAIRGFTGPADYAWDFNAPDGGMAGFSPELTGDVGRLLAQAIGSVEAPEERPPEAEEAPSVAEAAAAPPAEAPPPEVPQDAQLAEAPGDGPAHEAPLAPATPMAELPTVRRRHGGAVPT